METIWSGHPLNTGWHRRMQSQSLINTCLEVFEFGQRHVFGPGVTAVVVVDLALELLANLRVPCKLEEQTGQRCRSSVTVEAG